MERPRWRIVQTYKEAYGGLPRAAWLLALLELVNRSGMMVLFFFTLYMTRRLGFTVVQAGSVMSAYGSARCSAPISAAACATGSAPTTCRTEPRRVGGAAGPAAAAAQPVAAGAADARPRGLQRRATPGERGGDGADLHARAAAQGLRAASPGRQPRRQRRPGGRRLSRGARLQVAVLGGRAHDLLACGLAFVFLRERRPPRRGARGGGAAGGPRVAQQRRSCACCRSSSASGSCSRSSSRPTRSTCAGTTA